MLSRTPVAVIDPTEDDFWSDLRGDLIRHDVPMEEANLWIAVIVRAIADGGLDPYYDYRRYTEADARSREEFLFRDSARVCGLAWIADHLSHDPQAFIAFWRRADREAWTMKRKHVVPDKNDPNRPRRPRGSPNRSRTGRPRGRPRKAPEGS